MSSQRCFFDTNIALYCFDKRDERKQGIAKDLIAQAATNGMGVVSHQVLQEFCNVASSGKLLGLTDQQTLIYVKLVLTPMLQVLPSYELLERALAVRAQTRYSFYDSLVVAAAIASDCRVLYSEDMQNGRVIEQVTIVNPFAR